MLSRKIFEIIYFFIINFESNIRFAKKFVFFVFVFKLMKENLFKKRIKKKENCLI